MNIFEHFSVFVSITLGLAVVHLLGGLSFGNSATRYKATTN